MAVSLPMHTWLDRLKARRQSGMAQSDEWQASLRNLYVMPTGVGCMVALTTAVLLVASINYQINLGFLFTFMLAGVTLVSVLVGHANLRGLRLRLQPPVPVFAHQAAQLSIQLSGAPGGRRRWAIRLRPRDSAAAVLITDLTEGLQRPGLLALGVLPRGLHPCPVLCVETLYPLGAFRIWTLWQPAARVLVYPAPEPDPPAWRQAPDGGDTALAASRADSLEHDGYRTYQRGDPLRSIVWKKSATALATGHGDWLRRDHARQGLGEIWLDHGETGLQQREAVLARLCAWVLQADRQGLAYGLRLPATEIAPARGSSHRHRCLEALALS